MAEHAARRLAASFREAPGRFTLAAVAGGVGMGVVSFNLLFDEGFMSIPDVQQQQRRSVELQERGILKFEAASSRSGIPRLDADDARLRAQARAQEQALIEMLNGLKDKSRKEKLQDAMDAMTHFMVPPAGSEASTPSRAAAQAGDP